MSEMKTYDKYVIEASNRDPEKWDEIKFHANIVSRIVTERIKKGINQEKLAELTGLKQSAIARIESCKCVPKITTLQKILLKLDLTLEVRPRDSSFISHGKILSYYKSDNEDKKDYLIGNDDTVWNKTVPVETKDSAIALHLKECV